MFENLANMSKLLKNLGGIKEKIQGMKQDLEGKRVNGSDEGKEVSVTMTGVGVVERIDIGDAFELNSEARAALEAQVLSAVNQAIAQAKALHIEAVRNVSDELGLSGMIGLDKILEEMA
jgi:nucleoid-associated protein EbfC